MECQPPSANANVDPIRQTIYSEFADGLKSIARDKIYVITDEDYTSLIELEGHSARELPQGLYLVDKTLREYLAESNIAYGQLNREVVDSVKAYSENNEQAELVRNSSAHKVVFGTIAFLKHGTELTTANIAIKRHVEHGRLSEKPYKEIGNMAILQGLDQKGVYSPIGVLQTDKSKFVMSAFRPRVVTLDNHTWANRSNRLGKTREEKEYQITRDTAILSKTLELFGMIHAQGIFHGDAQAKNIGYTETQNLSVGKMYEGNKSLNDLELTIVDLENTIIFKRDEEGNYPKDYYEKFIKLALDDIDKLISHIPKVARTPLYSSNNTPEEEIKEFINSNFVQPYLESLLKHWQKQLGSVKVNDNFIEELKTKIYEQIYAASR